MIVLALVILTVSGTIHAGHLAVGLVGPSEHGTVIQGPGAKASLVGPDGSHISSAVGGGTVVAPAKAGGAISAAVAPGYITAAVVPAPVTFHSGISVAGLGLAGGPAYGINPGSGYEGQYVPDYNEQSYDDGSYKGDYYESHY